MPTPTTKTRQDLRNRFVRNAIPTEEDFANLIAAGLNQADDGLFKLPEEPLSLVGQKGTPAVLRFFTDPQAPTSVWQVQLSDGTKPGFGLAGADGTLALFVDGATGNVGIGTTTPDSKLTIENRTKGKDHNSNLTSHGMLAIKDICPQLDFIDVDGSDWCIYVDNHKMYFIHEPWDCSGLCLVGAGRIGMGTENPDGKLHLFETTGTGASPTTGSLLLDHDDAGGASSIVFRSKLNREKDHAFIEFQDKNPAASGSEDAALLTIATKDGSGAHVALMPSGNVGIGTSTPAYKLDINGNAGISGSTTITTPCKSDSDPASHLALLSPDTGHADFCTKILFQQANQYSGWISYHGNSTDKRGEFAFLDTNAGQFSRILAGDILSSGKIKSSNLKLSASATSEQGVGSKDWEPLADMIIRIDLTTRASFFILFTGGGIQCTQGDKAQVEFGLFIDNTLCASTHHEFDTTGWGCRDACLSHLAAELSSGTHSIAIKCRLGHDTIPSPLGSVVGISMFGSTRSLHVIEL